jgi:hypothetical protein
MLGSIKRQAAGSRHVSSHDGLTSGTLVVVTEHLFLQGTATAATPLEYFSRQHHLGQ